MSPEIKASANMTIASTPAITLHSFNDRFRIQGAGLEEAARLSQSHDLINRHGHVALNDNMKCVRKSLEGSLKHMDLSVAASLS